MEVAISQAAKSEDQSAAAIGSEVETVHRVCIKSKQQQ
jgi:hypothetical protein